MGASGNRYGKQPAPAPGRGCPRHIGGWTHRPVNTINGVNLSFVDGQVESHRWRECATLGPVGGAGFRRTTSTDGDILWLQYHLAPTRWPGDVEPGVRRENRGQEGSWGGCIFGVPIILIE